MTPALASEYSKENAGPGLPEDADYTLIAKLLPATGDGFGRPEPVAGVVANSAQPTAHSSSGTEIRDDEGTHC
ncbi:hypothetical protein ACIOGX_13445 [Streptomyces sp. NPDC088147]|uniref:hypothetical protein n=1 Tax=unclassified Streptomyces TaxID=2593676 RepID=UPI0033ABB611